MYFDAVENGIERGDNNVMTRTEILDAAEKCVCGHREEDYGKPEDNFSTIAMLWSVYIRAALRNRDRDKQTITAKDVAIMMALLKIARIASGSNQDNFVDLAGYAACAGEIESYEVEKGETT